MKTRYIFFLLVLFIATSCEKVVDVDVEDAGQQLVIEGVLNDDGSPATVNITRTISLTGINNFPAVSNASVMMTDDAGNSYSLPLTSAGVYQNDSVEGVGGRTYFLTVNLEGKTYTAQSTMPALTPFDSLGIDSITFGGEATYTLTPYHFDPPGVKNSYRYKIFVNGVADKTIQVDNDDFTDGRYVSRPFFPDMDMDLNPGDILTMEMYNIDPAVYLYFFSLAQIGEGPDASATPANPVSNISGGCLGYFSAQRKQVRSKPIPASN
jgi:hypothetical protein